MKKYLLLLAAVLMTAGAAFEVEVRISPRRPAVGQPVGLTLTTQEQIDRNVALPEVPGIRWLRNARSEGQSIINGRASFTRTFTFIPEKEGELAIPEFEVSSGGKTGKVPPRNLTVVAASERRTESGGGESVSLGEAVSGELKTVRERSEFYTGEEIPLVLDLLILARVANQVRVEEYPRLTGLDGAVFNDYSKTNPDQRRFDRPGRFETERNGKEYIVLRFTTGVRALKSGTLTVGASDRVGIVQSRAGRGGGSPFDDDFFDSFFNSSRTTPHLVEFRPRLSLAIVNPPPVPAGALSLGLIGNFSVSARLGASSCRVGEPAELTVEVTGTGGAETVVAPKIEIPGFRVYPPEIKKSASGATLKYALVPLEPGEKKIQLKFAVFQPDKKSYEIFNVDLAAAVAPGNVKNAPQVVADAAPAAAEPAAAEKSEEAPREEIFYQKPEPGSVVKLPLVRNALVWMLLLAVGAPVATGLIFWRRRRRQWRLADPRHEEKLRRKEELPRLLRELKRGNPDAEFVRREILPFLASGCGLPPGASAGELAELLADPGLRDFFNALEADSFRPGGKEGAAAVAPPLRRRLAALLKKAVMFFLVFSGITLGAAPTGFNAPFDAGNFQAAALAYEKYLAPGESRPNVLYNLGGCAWREGKLPLARYWFLKAHLLAPRDVETVENLNLINRRLLCPEVDRTDTPEELLVYCRDRIRPDTWMLLGTAAFALLVLMTLLFRSAGPGVFWTAEGIAAAVLLLSIAAATAQMKEAYNPSRAVVVAERIELRTLPSLAAGKVEAAIPGGGDAEVIEERDGFSRIAVNGRDGWVRSDQVRRVLPEGLF